MGQEIVSTGNHVIDHYLEISDWKSLRLEIVGPVIVGWKSRGRRGNQWAPEIVNPEIRRLKSRVEIHCYDK